MKRLLLLTLTLLTLAARAQKDNSLVSPSEISDVLPSDKQVEDKLKQVNQNTDKQNQALAALYRLILMKYLSEFLPLHPQVRTSLQKLSDSSFTSLHITCTLNSPGLSMLDDLNQYGLYIRTPTEPSLTLNWEITPTSIYSREYTLRPTLKASPQIPAHVLPAANAILQTFNHTKIYEINKACQADVRYYTIRIADTLRHLLGRTFAPSFLIRMTTTGLIERTQDYRHGQTISLWQNTKDSLITLRAITLEGAPLQGIVHWSGAITATATNTSLFSRAQHMPLKPFTVTWNGHNQTLYIEVINPIVKALESQLENVQNLLNKELSNLSEGQLSGFAVHLQEVIQRLDSTLNNPAALLLAQKIADDLKNFIRKNLSEKKQLSSQTSQKHKESIHQVSEQSAKAAEAINSPTHSTVIGDYEHYNMHEPVLLHTSPPQTITADMQTVLSTDPQFAIYIRSHLLAETLLDSIFKHLTIVRILDSLLQTDFIDSLAHHVIEGLKNDITREGPKIILDILNGKEPQLEKIVKQIITNQTNKILSAAGIKP